MTVKALKKQLMAAIAMVVVSAIALSSSTYAWFAANNTVTATNLQVKAKAEGGIVIAAYTQTSSSVATKTGGSPFDNSLSDAVLSAPALTTYTNTATMSLSAAELFPTSTADTTAWYHANSNDVNDYAAVASTYATLASTNLKTDGKYYTGTGEDAENAYGFQGQYFLYNKYSVKASDAGTYSLWVSDITVTGSANTVALNNSMRIAIKVGDGAVQYFAPMYSGNDTTTTLYYYNGTARTAGTPAKGSTPNIQVANNTITSTATDVQVWVYYEGEDEDCKTFNASAVTIDTLNIQLTFTAVNPAS